MGADHPYMNEGDLQQSPAKQPNSKKTAFKENEELHYLNEGSSVWEEGVFVRYDGTNDIIIKPNSPDAQNVKIPLFKGRVQKKIRVDD